MSLSPFARESISSFIATVERTGQQEAATELRNLVANDQLPLMRLVAAKPPQMQAFHLSFQEYYAMRAIAGGACALPDFRVGDVWWTNAVLMGVQTGDAFGKAFAEAIN